MTKILGKERMTEKLLFFTRNVRKDGCGGPRGFILNYSNKCNFRCAHCYTRSGKGEFGKTKLTLDDIKSIADQADALGVYEIDIQGGEPLLYPNLFEILEAIDTQRFYTYITTNGWLLNEEMAKRLAKAGVDRISVSIDAFSSEAHDSFRNQAGSYERALHALQYAQEAKMKAYVNIVVGHYNAQSDELKQFLSFAEENKWGIVFNCAMPTGNWQGNYDVMLTEEDTHYIEQLRKKNKKIIRDLWNYFDPCGEQILGCPAVNLFYVNPLGDVLPCPFIHVKIGNVKEAPLEDILKNGFRVKYFREYNQRCLAGENRMFAEKYLNREMSVLEPILLQDLFDSDDYI